MRVRKPRPLPERLSDLFVLRAGWGVGGGGALSHLFVRCSSSNKPELSLLPRRANAAISLMYLYKCTTATHCEVSCFRSTLYLWSDKSHPEASPSALLSQREKNQRIPAEQSPTLLGAIETPANRNCPLSKFLEISLLFCKINCVMETQLKFVSGTNGHQTKS